MSLVECVIEDDRWREAGIEALADRAGAAALRHLGLDPEEWEISLLACDDARIATLNADFRGKPSPTNVLSWPSEDRAPEAPGAVPDLPETYDPELGDIAIAWETCEREAREGGKPLTEHATHLIVHAILHLLGYDHVRDEDATLMEQTEAVILGKLGIQNPYD